MRSEDNWPLIYKLLRKRVAVRGSRDEWCNLMSLYTRVISACCPNHPQWKRGLENTDVRGAVIKNESEADRALVIHPAPVESGGRRAENHKESEMRRQAWEMVRGRRVSPLLFCSETARDKATSSERR